VAEVVNQLMASPWSVVFDTSPQLKESFQGLPEEAQAVLALQHEKLMAASKKEAQGRAKGGQVPENVKTMADKMKSIRAAPAPAPKKEKPADKGAAWKEAKTPEGHSYYYNVETKETTWERPKELGGPYKYVVDEEVEVWSNSKKKWGQGKVTKVADGQVTAEFEMPDGSKANKVLPAAHKDLRPAMWPAKEKAAYQKLFDEIDSKGLSKEEKPAMGVAKCLARSGLSRAVLKQIWAVANPTNTATWTMEEFCKSCRLVGHCQALGASAPIMKEADRPLRHKLRGECLTARPPTVWTG